MTDKADLIISNGTVLTMDESLSVIEDGAVLISSGTIRRVGKRKELSPLSAERTIDAGGGWIMPGLVNCHTHAAMTLFRGLADDLPLMTWLTDHIFPAEAALDEETVYRASLLAMAEMIMTGTTTFCDMYLFEDSVARAADEAGMRGIVGEVLYDFPSPNYGPIDKGFAYTRMLIDKWRGHPLITIAVEPHSPYLCAPTLLTKAFEISETEEIPLVIHLSETQSEVDTIRKRHRKTPVGYLAGLGILSHRTVACHCVFLSREDMRLLRKNRTGVAHNPESNMKLASGVADIPALIDCGIRVGLGTDGTASNNNLDMFQEMNTASRLHKVTTGSPTALSARSALQMATSEGAKVLGMGAVTGSIEEGKSADIIVIDRKKPHLTPAYDPFSHIVYAASGSDVETTVVGGRVLMEKRELKTLDAQKIMAEVNAIAKGLKK